MIMHFISVAVLFSLLLPVVVLSVPIDAPPSDLLYTRAIVVVIQPDPSGDFKDLLHPKPADPGDRPLKCTKQEMKDWKQLKAKHTAWTKLHTDFEGLVTTRVTAAIHAAETQLHLTGPLHVSVKSLYHRSRTDDLHHWTFSFSAPACGAGRCVGHAYEAGAVNGRQARIFSSAHVPIFGA